MIVRSAHLSYPGFIDQREAMDTDYDALDALRLSFFFFSFAAAVVALSPLLSSALTQRFSHQR